jgi:hypothetical protein
LQIGYKNQVETIMDKERDLVNLIEEKVISNVIKLELDP